MPFLIRISGGLPPPGTFGVGQHEEPLAKMRRADFRRREQSFRNPVAQFFQLFSDLPISDVEMIGDVFQKHPFWPTLADDAGEVRPQVPGVVRALAPPGDGERLARIAANEAIHDATPRAAVEGSQIRPYRRVIQACLFHARRQDFAGMALFST